MRRSDSGIVFGVALAALVVPGVVRGAEMEGATLSPADRAAERKIMGVLEDLYENQRQGMMNVPPADGRLLRLLTEAAGARHVVEIGTSNGYSGIWFCLALRTTGGKLTTFEIDAHRASLARENFKRAGVAELITLVEGDAHVEVTKLKGPIDVVFIDADKAGYHDYLTKLLPVVRPGGLIIAHNTTSAGPAMEDYLKAVTTNPDLETIFLHEADRGVGVTLKKRAAPAGPAGRRGSGTEGQRDGGTAGTRDRAMSGGAVLGYVNHILPESPEARAARHAKVAERRAKEPPIMVHRGDRESAPENTLEAYAAAMDLGADGVEIDIRRSKDGVLYLFHDDDLDRLTNGSGKVRDVTYYELLKLTPKQISGRATKETRPPTLAAFVEIARQHAMLLHLDVKEAGLQDEIMRMLDEADAWDQVVEVNAGNADRIRAHAKVKLLPYKGWAPEGKYADDPDAIRHALSRDGVMIFTKDPRPVVEFLNRPVSDPTPIPQRTRAPWIPGGVVVSAR